MVCVFVLLQGGLKAAITADVIQGVTMIGVTVLVVVKGVLLSDGVANVYNINSDNGECPHPPTPAPPTRYVQIANSSRALAQMVSGLIFNQASEANARKHGSSFYNERTGSRNTRTRTQKKRA